MPWGKWIAMAVNQLPVMVGDQIQGVLGRDDVISLLRTLREFSPKVNVMPQTPHPERHFTGSEIVRDIVIGFHWRATHPQRAADHADRRAGSRRGLRLAKAISK